LLVVCEWGLTLRAGVEHYAQLDEALAVAEARHPELTLEQYPTVWFFFSGWTFTLSEELHREDLGRPTELRRLVIDPHLVANHHCFALRYDLAARRRAP
jgi:hypothetical protein